MRPNVLRGKNNWGIILPSTECYLRSKVMKLKTETGLTFKMKKELTPKPTPLIKKMKLESSPIFEKKRNRNSTGTITWKMMQTMELEPNRKNCSYHSSFMVTQNKFHLS